MADFLCSLYPLEMILGIGIDAVNILRFNYYADRIPGFLSRMFSPLERSLSNTQLAGNFAACEAFLKACPAEVKELISKVEFLRNPNGKPTIELRDLQGKQISFFNVHLSITNLDNLVIALIILEK